MLLLICLLYTSVVAMFSIVFKGVYREWILKEYKFRNNEKLGIENNQLKYSYVGTFGTLSLIHICYLKSENPIALLRGNKTLAEYGIRNGTLINFTE